MIINPHPDYAKLTTEGIQPKLDIGGTIDIDGTSYELIQKSSPNNTGYAGYAYENTATGEIVIIH